MCLTWTLDPCPRRCRLAPDLPLLESPAAIFSRMRSSCSGESAAPRLRYATRRAASRRRVVELRPGSPPPAATSCSASSMASGSMSGQIALGPAAQGRRHVLAGSDTVTITTRGRCAPRLNRRASVEPSPSRMLVERDQGRGAARAQHKPFSPLAAYADGDRRRESCAAAAPTRDGTAGGRPRSARDSSRSWLHFLLLRIPCPSPPSLARVGGRKHRTPACRSAAGPISISPPVLRARAHDRQPVVVARIHRRRADAAAVVAAPPAPRRPRRRAAPPGMPRRGVAHHVRQRPRARSAAQHLLVRAELATPSSTASSTSSPPRCRIRARRLPSGGEVGRQARANTSNSSRSWR